MNKLTNEIKKEKVNNTKKVKLKPRSYQKDAIDKICADHITNKSRIVLAAATGSGKTEMAVIIIENFIQNNYGKILVVTHHTNVIKENFVDRLDEINPNFTYSDTNTNVDVYVTIRQNIIKLNMSDYDLLIVDEAHHDYFSDTMQKRVNSIKHQVLLTATPSRFVKKGGYNILPIGRLDIANKFYAKLNFICINSDNYVKHDDLNKDGVLRSTYNFQSNEMLSAVSSVVPQLNEGKKLFIFRNIKDAKKGSRLLKNGFGINAPVSDSQSDPCSKLVNSFKSSGLDALCVVDRMRLGYSDNDLYYTIDMTFTHNPNTIYQMMSRSNRGIPSMNKYYIKVTNNELNEYTRVIVSVALALFKSENIVKYNGKDFKGIQIPVTQKKPKRNMGEPNGKKKKNSREIIIPDVLDDIVAFFDTADYVDGEEVIRALTGKRKSWRKEKVIKLAVGKSKTEFDKHSGAYSHAKKNGYYNELNLVGEKTIWTKEKVMKLADGMNTTEFFKYRGAHNHAKINGYYNELNLLGKRTSWTKEKVMTVADGMNKTDFNRKFVGALFHAKRNGYYSELNLVNARTIWTKEKAMNVAC